MIVGKDTCGILYAVKRSSSAVAYCSLSIKCGTRNEGGFHGGIAHFTEHTLFKGCAHKSAAVINGYLDRLGGELNAYTTKEEIVIHATVLKEDLQKATSLLLELTTGPSFPEKEIETERGVVIDEINSVKDCPADEIYDKFEEKLFEGHPLSKPILGTAESVREISSEELRSFTKENFVPGRMAMAIVADIEEEKMEKELKKLLRKYFSQNGESLLGQVPFETLTPPPHRQFDLIENKHNHEVNEIIGGLAPSLYAEKDRLTAILLCNILGGPASNSILNETLRERNGWVYNVETNYTQYMECGIFAICLGCEKENIKKCTTAVRKTLRKLQEAPLSERRLKAAKKQLFGQMAISSDNGEAQCLSMGKSLLAYGKVLTDNVLRTKLEAISAEDLRTVACQLFGEGKLSRLVYL